MLCGITPIPPAKRVTRVSLGAEDILPWEYHASSLAGVRQLQAEGFTLVALEVTSDAVTLDSFIPPEKCALIIGNEVSGVSKEVLAACGTRVAIPMAGRKASLNAAIAFGIAAQHIRTTPSPY
jgi:tRNA G18 (ribose-2'-O)-methylase SpoU